MSGYSCLSVLVTRHPRLWHFPRPCLSSAEPVVHPRADPSHPRHAVPPLRRPFVARGGAQREKAHHGQDLGRGWQPPFQQSAPENPNGRSKCGERGCLPGSASGSVIDLKFQPVRGQQPSPQSVCVRGHGDRRRQQVRDSSITTLFRIATSRWRRRLYRGGKCSRAPVHGVSSERRVEESR